jgi:hypothetical protein
LDKVITLDYGHILHNKDNIAIRSLLLDFFEEETVDSFHLLKEFPARNIEGYLHDCCSITADICRSIWTMVERYNISDILPSDDVLQKYMSYLNGRPVEEQVLEEIKVYEERLAKRLESCRELKNNDLARAVDIYNVAADEAGYYDLLSDARYSERPPFPLLEMYTSIWHLGNILEEKLGLFVFNLVTELGRVRLLNKEESQLKRDVSLNYILKDKRFLELASALKKDFDAGYEQFSERDY